MFYSRFFEGMKKGKEEDTHYIYSAGARERKTMLSGGENDDLAKGKR